MKKYTKHFKTYTKNSERWVLFQQKIARFEGFFRAISADVFSGATLMGIRMGNKLLGYQARGCKKYILCCKCTCNLQNDIVKYGTV